MDRMVDHVQTMSLVFPERGFSLVLLFKRVSVFFCAVECS